MNRELEETIQVLQTALTSPLIYGEYRDAIVMAIEELKAKTEGDLISRQDAIKIVDQFSRAEMFHYMESLELDVRATHICHSAIEAVGTIKEQIESLPSAEPRTGKWIKYDSTYHTAICSRCEKVTMFETWDGKVRPYDFCPNCGSRNVREDGEEE